MRGDEAAHSVGSTRITCRAGDPVVGLLLSAASRHVEADLAFVDDAEGVLLADGAAVLARLRTSRSEGAPPEQGTAPNRAAG
ncbi:hypothetical protein AB0D32_14550 [Micromonospora sp. NPDC048170]|uniref:hypothetical protein n=1 Tax=Micromonospora sp. NPDC048170 TaxID=3154819 RepID=UPI0033CB25D9